ncbi:MAG: hypothetical protein RMY31_017550 [Dendronalium sp. ChiSLP03b]|nr:hypothetical protein [Dendronalium sp. ChiSLP03b]MDZ8203092.1 hypothetical protein [Dendronalium sp. ChiSLP03b]
MRSLLRHLTVAATTGRQSVAEVPSVEVTAVSFADLFALNVPVPLRGSKLARAATLGEG